MNYYLKNFDGFTTRIYTEKELINEVPLIVVKEQIKNKENVSVFRYIKKHWRLINLDTIYRGADKYNRTEYGKMNRIDGYYCDCSNNKLKLMSKTEAICRKCNHYMVEYKSANQLDIHRFDSNYDNLVHKIHL